MSKLRIDLQEGFKGDQVTISINNKVVFDKDNVTTRLQTGYADSIEVYPEQDTAKVDIRLPLKNLSHALSVPVTAPVYLGVSVTPDGRLSTQISHDPFGYV